MGTGVSFNKMLLFVLEVDDIGSKGFTGRLGFLEAASILSLLLLFLLAAALTLLFLLLLLLLDRFGLQCLLLAQIYVPMGVPLR